MRTSGTVRTRPTPAPTAKGDRRRATILAACEQLLGERSYGDLQIAEITEQAGVTRPAFYFYFPNKAAAIAALLGDVTEQLMTAAEAWYEGEGDVAERLADGFERTVEIWRDHAALFAAMIEAAATDDEAAALWATMFERFRARMADRIEADVGDDLRSFGGPTPDGIASVLASMAFHMMERDVRSVLATGAGLPETEPVLRFAFLRTIYGRTS